jgi:hypothetical protein
MPTYETLKRCHLPDLDLTVPVSDEVTWGRPLTQEEINDVNAVLGVPHGLLVVFKERMNVGSEVKRRVQVAVHSA